MPASVLRRKCSFSGRGEDRDLPMGTRRIRAHLTMLQHLLAGGRAEEEESVSRVIKRDEQCPRWVITERRRGVTPHGIHRPEQRTATAHPGPPTPSRPHCLLPGAQSPSFRLFFAIKFTWFFVAVVVFFFPSTFSDSWIRVAESAKISTHKLFFLVCFHLSVCLSFFRLPVPPIEFAQLFLKYKIS